MITKISQIVGIHKKTIGFHISHENLFKFAQLQKNRQMILITGACGMLGNYVALEFAEEDVTTLGLRSESDLRCDLTESVPDFGNKKFETVIHCAGSEDNGFAMALNLEGTKNLLKGLKGKEPENFVYVSSYRVYSQDAGENVCEDENLWASDETGKSKALAEEILKDWCKKNKINLSILRPAWMFGNGVKGETLQLFNDALTGKYIHIRGNEARVSIVTAYDVAKSIKLVHKKGGIYNVADGTNPKLIELVESMTANAGSKKRMTHLPASWAEWLWRFCKWIPSINRNLSPEIAAKRMKTLTIDGSKLTELGLDYHNTLSVMEHTDSSYPYSESNNRKDPNIHEV